MKMYGWQIVEKSSGEFCAGGGCATTPEAAKWEGNWNLSCFKNPHDFVVIVHGFEYEI